MNNKNKVVVATLSIVKDSISKGESSIYNPILLIGLNKNKRYEMFFRIFDKDFKSKYREVMMYKKIDEIDIEKVKTKRLIIIENIELAIENIELEEKLEKLLDLCLLEKRQLILCTDRDIKNEKFAELIKAKMFYGLPLYLEDWRR